MAKTTTPKKVKPAKAVKAPAAVAATKCIALAVGHRSCPCADCNPDGNYSPAPKK